MLAALGFSTIGIFLLLTMTKRVSVLVALVLLPVLAALAGGFAGELGEMVLDGLSTVAPTGIMIAFAVLYFSLMVDAGLFDPLIRGILRVARNDPARITVGTAVLTMCVALDGDGASTFLITVSALLPVYKRLGMSPLVLSGVVCLAAGVMNMIPWGGPTVRAMAALKLDSSEVFTPVLPAMGCGLAWVLLASYLIGRRERRRLGALTPQGEVDAGTERDGCEQPTRMAGDGPGTPWVPARPRTWPSIFNLVLTIALLVSLVLEVMPLPVLFALAFTLALLVNRPTWEGQQALLEKHAKSVVLVTTMIFAAGVFTGVLTGTKMITEMAEAFVSVVPDSLGGHLPVLVAVTGMPLSLAFTPDAYYFGVLPVLSETAAGFGTDQAEVARAAILGQMTTGFPLSPLTASTFILVGMSGVQLGEHQRFIFRWAFATTLVMTAAALLTGAFSL
ncbi:CitMHS family transporter [Streptomyces nigrescens]|uniref:Citrate transporter n=1 Tax=Streptomyces nigrescens TaxID=1920 RepID=A0A640TUG7_STRNI|nr:citrate:proton symporter [Streptomyces libani]WAU01386.1 citrate:proton symporter [Streptomyces libani subsp. libani]GFE27307.1 citrate transporter [Streptomyces libani subsp. libani]GGV96506.1 citrate transporter [Streptomyces libani subsp. libani]